MLSCFWFNFQPTSSKTEDQHNILSSEPLALNMKFPIRGERPCSKRTTTSSAGIVLTGHVLRRLDLSNLTHHRPLVRGNDYALISSAQWRNKWPLSFTFWPVLINGWCIGYILADDSCMNRTR